MKCDCGEDLHYGRCRKMKSLDERLDEIIREIWHVNDPDFGFMVYEKVAQIKQAFLESLPYTITTHDYIANREMLEGFSNGYNQCLTDIKEKLG